LLVKPRQGGFIVKFDRCDAHTADLLADFNVTLKQ